MESSFPVDPETTQVDRPAPEAPPRPAVGETPPHDRGMTTEAGTPVPQIRPDQIDELIAEQKAMRQELAAARQETAQARDEARRAARPAGPPAAVLDPEELRQARLKELADHEFYCPGCGALYDYPQKCEGKPEAPHQKIEVVSTKEVQGAPDPKDVDNYRQWEEGHTAAPNTDLDSLRRAGVL